jgi:hypothetical protein
MYRQLEAKTATKGITTRSTWGRFVSIVLLVLLVAPLAWAAGKEDKERAARKACLSGDYAKGVEILSDLFIDTKDPTYIFNQARCFEQNSRCEEAISRFREYLRKATVISPKDKTDTETHIIDCQALLNANDPSVRAREGVTATASSALAAPTHVPPVTSTAPGTPSSAALTATSGPEQVTMTNVTTTVGNPGRGLRSAGVTCGAVGLASIGTAIYFYTQARAYSNKVSNEAIPVSADEQSGKNAQTMQWVFYSVGGAAIATGTVLLLLGLWSGDAASTTAGVAPRVGPLVGPGVAGISAQGAF